jgi:Na+/melibiose symporter-like transporter
VGITYGLSQSAAAGSFTSRSVVVPVVLGVALCVAFVLRARRISHALLDLGLYRVRAYSSATVVMFCLGAALFGAMILLPLYFQEARGQDAIHTGMLMIPQGIGASIGMNRSARATRRLGAGLTSLCGVVVMVVATVPFLFIGARTGYPVIGVAMVVRGVGVGLALMPAMTAAFGALGQDQINDASPQLNVIQRVGGSLGTAVVAVVLQTKLAHLSSGPGHVASASAIATSFAQTYWWVIVMLFLALISAAVLWRVERQTGRDGYLTGARDEAMVEALA